MWKIHARNTHSMSFTFQYANLLVQRKQIPSRLDLVARLQADNTEGQKYSWSSKYTDNGELVSRIWTRLPK